MHPNDYILAFPNTVSPTTLYVATSATSDPSVLADPAKRALLTDGPTITLYGPNGTTQIFGAPATTQPVDFLQLTKPSGTFSSQFAVTNSNYIPPTIANSSYSRMLEANAGSLFSDFIGTGTVELPVMAMAFSSYFSNSGNGTGTVLTEANATVTIEYLFSSSVSVPEPSSAILLGLGIGIGILATRLRRRGTSRRE